MTFEADCHNDIYVGLYAESSTLPSQVNHGDAIKMYEINLGAWRNSVAVVRHGPGLPKKGTDSQGPDEGAVVTVTDNCKHGEFKPYWISYNAAIGSLTAGHGRSVGFGDPLISHTWSTEHKYEVQYVSFSSWDRPVHYRNLRFTTKPTLGHQLWGDVWRNGVDVPRHWTMSAYLTPSRKVCMDVKTAIVGSAEVSTLCTTAPYARTGWTTVTWTWSRKQKTMSVYLGHKLKGTMLLDVDTLPVSNASSWSIGRHPHAFSSGSLDAGRSNYICICLCYL